MRKERDVIRVVLRSRPAVFIMAGRARPQDSEMPEKDPPNNAQPACHNLCPLPLSSFGNMRHSCISDSPPLGICFLYLSLNQRQTESFLPLFRAELQRRMCGETIKFVLASLCAKCGEWLEAFEPVSGVNSRETRFARRLGREARV